MKMIQVWTAGLFAAFMGIASPVFAQSSGATAAMAALETEAQGMLDLAWPIVVLVTVGILAIRLFKKISSKAV